VRIPEPDRLRTKPSRRLHRGVGRLKDHHGARGLTVMQAAAGAFAGLAVLLSLGGSLLQSQELGLLLFAQPLAVLVGPGILPGRSRRRRHSGPVTCGNGGDGSEAGAVTA
jgi:hypothetical protein